METHLSTKCAAKYDRDHRIVNTAWPIGTQVDKSGWRLQMREKVARHWRPRWVHYSAPMSGVFGRLRLTVSTRIKSSQLNCHLFPAYFVIMCGKKGKAQISLCVKHVCLITRSPLLKGFRFAIIFLWLGEKLYSALKLQHCVWCFSFPWFTWLKVSYFKLPFHKGNIFRIS